MSIFDIFNRSVPKETLLEIQSLHNEVSELQRQLEDSKSKPKGYFSAYDKFSTTSEVPSRNLTFTQLRDSYEKSLTIRKAVDQIAQRVGQLRYIIIPDEGEQIDEALVTSLFKSQNLSGETFRELRMRITVDLLVINKGAIFISKNPLGIPKQLYSRDASLLAPIFDEYGVLKSYKMGESTALIGKDVVEFSPSELVYIDAFPKTYNLASEPVIEAAANEIAYLLNLAERSAFFAKRERLEPGFLRLGKIADEAYVRAKESFKAAKSGDAIRVVDNVDIADWIKMGEAVPQNLFLMFDKYSTVVAEAFGYDKKDTGFVGQSILVQTIALIIQDKVNEFLGPYIKGQFKFVLLPGMSAAEVALLVRSGVLTPNDARDFIGLPPVEGGDKISVLSPTGLEQLGETVKPKEEGTEEGQISDSIQKESQWPFHYQIP